MLSQKEQKECAWIIELAGERFDLQELFRLDSPSKIEVSEEADGFYLRSDEFESYTEPRAVLDRAIELVSILNGIAQIEIQNWENVTVAGVARQEPDGKRTRFLFAEPMRGRSRMSGNLTITRADGSKKSSHDNTFEAIADLVTRDANVTRVLRLFGSGMHTWVNLYKIYEIIESEIGREIVNRGWVNKDTIRNFKHTANSVSSAGDDARHGKELSAPPRSPMLLSEAESLIGKLLKNWLRSRQR